MSTKEVRRDREQRESYKMYEDGERERERERHYDVRAIMRVCRPICQG